MRVLIVDDELPIREWLKVTMSHVAEEGMEIKVASNGKEAWDICREWRPHMVMTDIRMPKMNGLELLQQIKESYPSIYVVMLTSYNEFEYAREAIKYRASEYVLKNEITTEILTKILNNYKENAAKRQVTDDHIYVKDLLKTYDETGEFPIKLEEGDHIFAIACSKDEADEEGFESYQNIFITKIQRYDYEKDVAVWVCSYKMDHSLGSMFGEAMDFCNNVASLKGAPVGFSGFIDDIPDACRKARKALNLQFYESHQNVFYYADTEEGLEEIKAMRKDIVSLIHKERHDEATEMLEKFLKKVEKEKVLNVEKIFSCFKDIVNAYKISKMEYADHEFCERCEETKFRISSCKNIQELQECINYFVGELKGNIIVGEKGYSNYVKSAIVYVSEHYGSIESIAEVADYVCLNADYFSRLFKSETGVTFNNYLTNYRIDKAVELLTKTDLKIYEVGEKVGYPNLSYFSRVFKKVKGVNPFFYKN